MLNRFDGNVVPFASEATLTNRTVFGAETQSDDIDDNLNADFKKGWEIVGLNDNPTREDFNAMGYTLGNLISYLYQNGVAEYNELQEYKTNSIAIASYGSIYQSLVDDNIGNALTDATKWICIASKNSIVNSIDELKTISNIEAVNVLGYYTKGDGGGGAFYWDSTSTETDNGGTIIQATGITTGRWKRVYSGAVNAKWFGAKGDGVVDDTAVINTIKSTQTSIDFDDGTYNVSYFNDIGILKTIHGSKQKTTFKRTGNATFISAAARDNLYIDNITIDNQKSVNGFPGHGISTYGDNQTFKNIKVVDYGSDGVGGGTGLLLAGDSIIQDKNARVIDCHFEAESTESAINIGWLAAGYTTSFFDRIYAKDIIKGIGYAHELKNDSTHNVLSNLISENSKVLLTYGQTTQGIDGADYNIATNILGKSTQSGYIVGEGHHNLLNGMLLDNNNNPISAGINSGDGIAYTGGAYKNVSTNILTSGTLANEVLYSDNASYNYTEVATYSESDYLVKLDVGANNNITNITHAGQRTSIKNILDNSGNGLGIGGNVVYSNGYGQYIGSLSGSWLWQIANVEPNYLSSSHWRFTDKNNTYLALGGDGSSGNAYGINFATPTSGNRGSFYFVLGETTEQDSYGMRLNGKTRYSFANSYFIPASNNAISLGTAETRWSVVYAGTGTINTSDDREKTYIDITEAEKQVAVELKANMKKFKFNDAIESKGEKARIHFGTSAQTVKSIFEKYGLNGFDYAILCYDEWEEQKEVKDEDGSILKPYRPAGDRYGIRYEELLCFIISAM